MMNVLAVDLGASNGRVIRAGFSGDALTLEEVHRFTNQPFRKANHLHWNFHDLYANVKTGIARAADAYGEIASIAVDSWAVDYGLIDKAGNLIDLPMHYRDKRNVAAMEDLLGLRGGAGLRGAGLRGAEPRSAGPRLRTSHLSPKELFLRTGIQLLPINTIFQVYAMMCETPEHLQSADKLLLIPDLVNFFLAGVKRAEFTNATTTQMLSAQTGQWDADIASMLGLSPHLLPELVQPGTIAGPITDANLCHHPALRHTRIVHTASHDTASAVVAVPNQSYAHAYISSGTWSLIGTVVSAPVVSDQAQAYNFTNEGGVGNYRLLKNVMGLWIVQEIQRDLAYRGKSADIAELVGQAKMAPAFTFLFDPDDIRLLQPDNMTDAILEICRESGQRIPQDIGVLLRGVFESIALKYRFVLEQLQDITEEKYQVIHVVGGGSQNELLCQFTANATGKTVIAGPVEASALGNVLIQLQALGEIKSQSEMKELVNQITQPIVYVPTDEVMWQDAYERFLDIVKQTHRGE